MRYCYKVTLLSDVVMSSLSSTEVSKSLDYLSGSALMGIAANYLFKTKSSTDVFDDIFSGKIRFLDAHPMMNGERSFKTPLCLHKPKVKDDGKFYRFNGEPVPGTEVDPNADPEDRIQMKQMRSGFCVADGLDWKKIEPEHQFMMKSSYDRDSRRADADALFGYDALAKGSKWIFVMEFDDEKKKIAEKLDEFFISKNHRIGKSRTSQYGNVKIEKIDEIKDRGTFDAKDNIYLVYADSRLCFFDENGQPTFQPTAEQLGFEGKEDKVLWNKSFVRKYVFTQRNGIRNAYDGDIASIEKGSVIVVKSENGYTGRKVVGEYRSIGLGQIIVNPDFLEKEPQKIEEYEDSEKTRSECSDPLIKWLEAKQKEKNVELEIAELVNGACSSLPKGISSSQWGVLRAKARMAIVNGRSWTDFEDELFSKTPVKIDKWGKEEKKGYLLKDRLNKIWKNKIKSLETAFGRAESHWTDIQKLRYFELLCAAAAKKSK